MNENWYHRLDREGLNVLFILKTSIGLVLLLGSEEVVE